MAKPTTAQANLLRRIATEGGVYMNLRNGTVKALRNLGAVEIDLNRGHSGMYAWLVLNDEGRAHLLALFGTENFSPEEPAADELSKLEDVLSPEEAAAEAEETRVNEYWGANWSTLQEHEFSGGQQMTEFETAHDLPVNPTFADLEHALLEDWDEAERINDFPMNQELYRIRKIKLSPKMTAALMSLEADPTASIAVGTAVALINRGLITARKQLDDGSVWPYISRGHEVTPDGAVWLAEYDARRAARRADTEKRIVDAQQPAVVSPGYVLNEHEREMARRQGDPNPVDLCICGKRTDITEDPNENRSFYATHWRTRFSSTAVANSCSEACSERIEGLRNAKTGKLLAVDVAEARRVQADDDAAADALVLSAGEVADLDEMLGELIDPHGRQPRPANRIRDQRAHRVTEVEEALTQQGAEGEARIIAGLRSELETERSISDDRLKSAQHHAALLERYRKAFERATNRSGLSGLEAYEESVGWREATRCDYCGHTAQSEPRHSPRCQHPSGLAWWRVQSALSQQAKNIIDGLVKGAEERAKVTTTEEAEYVKGEDAHSQTILSLKTEAAELQADADAFAKRTLDKS